MPTLYRQIIITCMASIFSIAMSDLARSVESPASYRTTSSDTTELEEEQDDLNEDDIKDDDLKEDEIEQEIEEKDDSKEIEKADQKAGSEEEKEEEKEEKEDKDNKDKEEDTAKKPQLRQLSLSGNYVDLVQPVSFDPLSLAMGGGTIKQKSFYRLCEYLDDLAENEQVKYVVFDLSDSNLSLNSAQLDELTRRIHKVKASKKNTFAWLENAANVHLAVAVACDQIIMTDFGGIDMPSMAMESMFYRDAMDLLGVKASVVRAGDFKGAVEPYTNPEMSTHLRAHYEQMLETLNEAYVDRVARGRGLKRADIRGLQQQRIILPQQALAQGLVDKLVPFGSMKATLKATIDEEVEWTTPKTVAKQQVSIFQLMGQIMAGPTSSGGRIRDNSIMVLHLSGTIIDGKKTSGGNIVSGPTVELIEKIKDDDKVKGVVVRVNSPGGSATASEAIRQALVELAKAKPTVISMGSIAASGGYWVSCIDAPIYAEKGTVTGSIGVFSMKLSVGSLMRRVGIHLESITLDDSAAAFSVSRPWSDNDVAVLQKAIDLVYDRFLELVSKARGIDVESLGKLAGGRVWSGTQAKERKLVDELGGLDDCLAVVAKKAKLDDDYHIVHRPVPQTGLNLAELLGQGDEEEIWEGVSLATLQILQQRGLSLQVTHLLLKDAITNRNRPTAWLLDPMELSVR